LSKGGDVLLPLEKGGGEGFFKKKCIFLKMSNTASPPAEPGVYLIANYTRPPERFWSLGRKGSAKKRNWFQEKMKEMMVLDLTVRRIVLTPVCLKLGRLTANFYPTPAPN
jgi:hypothetical protein